MSFEIITTAIVLITATTAAVTDLRWGKVPNWLTIPVLGGGVLISALAAGTVGLLMSLAGVGLAIALWIVTLALGGLLGGGDIKLLAALGALKGPRFLICVLVISIGIGGLMAIITALRHRVLGTSLQRVFRGLASIFVQEIPTQIVNESGSLRLPYAAAIAAGTVVALVYLRM